MNLEVGSASHAVQTAEVMRRIEPVLDDVAPRVRGRRGRRELDARGAALVAVEEGVSRSCTSRRGCAASTGRCPKRSTASSPTRSPTCSTRPSARPRDNLQREGIAAERIRFVGNVMIDSLLRHRARARRRPQARWRRQGWRAGVRGADRLRRGHAAPAVQRRRSPTRSRESLADPAGRRAASAARVAACTRARARTSSASD